MKRVIAFFLVLAVPVLALGKDGRAAGVIPQNDAASLSGSTLSAGQGVASVNEAAGDNNLQANSNAIALGGLASNTIHQKLTTSVQSASMDAAAITGHAFAAFSGILNVNQAAGANNLEANSVSISSSLQPLAPAQLTQLAPTITQAMSLKATRGSSLGIHKVLVGADAMKDISGIAQVSQTAGSGNILSNSVALNVSPGVIP